MDFVYQDIDEQGNVVPDPNFCVFVTPRQVAQLNIGLDLADYEGNEDDVQPFMVDSLVEMAREYILGVKANYQPPYRFPVEKARCFVTLCLEINGKLCRLHKDELGWPNPFTGLPLKQQVRTFQRLLDERRITLDDIAVADVDINVYKQLCINDVEGEGIWLDVLIQIGKWIVKQKNSKRWGKYFKLYENSPKLLWWEDMSTDAVDEK